MALLVDLTPAEERRLADEAGRRGVDAAWLARTLIRKGLPPGGPSVATPRAPVDPADWVRQFLEWVGSHDPRTPVPPPEAYDREKLYGDRV